MISKSLIVIPFHVPRIWQVDYTLQTCKVLSKSNKVIAFLWADSKSLKEIITDMFQKGNTFHFLKLKNNIIFITPIHWLPLRRFKIIEFFNYFMNCVFLRAFIQLNYHKIKKYIWIFHPDFYNFMDYFGRTFVSLYDCVDYFTSHDSSQNKRIREQELQLLKKANFMTVNSNTLLRLYKSKRENIRLVPQGFRLNNFREYKGLKICKADNNDKVVIGYIGGLNYRLNFELLMKIIKQNYNWEFHFIGPLQKNPEDKFYDSAKSIVKLLSLSNVKHDVIEDKKRIPHIIDGFTIGIIPYNDKDDHNRYCYPMKLFEYFYMGKPVVSTPIEEMKRFPKFVKIGKNAGEWEGIIKKLLSKPWPEKYKQEQRKLAIENSWENKIEAISKILEKK